MSLRLFATILALALLGGCGGGVPVQPPAELSEFQPTATLKLLWQGRVGAAERSTFYPAVSGSVVFAAGAAGGVTGFDAKTGNTVASIEVEPRISAGVGAGNGLVLVGTRTGEVLAFDRDGKLLWTTPLSGEVLAPPEAQDGTVVARTSDGRIHGLDVASGKSRWIHQRATPALSVRTHAGLVIERGGVFVGFPAGRLVALALASGSVGWEGVVALPRGTTELERIADVTSVPVIDGQQVCAAAYQGRVACFDAVRGTLLWARDVSSIAGIALDARYLYATDDKNAVLALDRTNGASIWRQDKLSGRAVTAPLPIGRYVAVGDIEGYVHLLSSEDGAFAARIATDGSPISAPPVALDTASFVVQTRNGGVYAIGVQ